MLYEGPLFPPAYTPKLVPKARRKRAPDRESILLSKEWLYLHCHVSRKVGELKAKLLGLQQPQQRACLRIGSSRLDKLDGAVRETRQVSKFLTREPSRNASELELFTKRCGHRVLLLRAVSYPERMDCSEALRPGSVRGFTALAPQRMHLRSTTRLIMGSSLPRCFGVDSAVKGGAAEPRWRLQPERGRRSDATTPSSSDR